MEWEIFQAKAVEKIKTHILCSVMLPEIRAICETMWENTVEPDSPEITIWRMGNACWIPKVKDTQYVVRISLPRKNGYLKALQC